MMVFNSVQAENNKFSFTGEIGEPYFVQILIKEGSSTSGKLTEFMLEASNIFIKGTEPKYEKVTVEGSRSDAVLKAYFVEDNVLTSRWDSLKVFYDKAVELNDSTARKHYAQKLNHITQVDRVELLRDYV
jgi:hypothetical protein